QPCHRWCGSRGWQSRRPAQRTDLSARTSAASASQGMGSCASRTLEGVEVGRLTEVSARRLPFRQIEMPVHAARPAGIAFVPEAEGRATVDTRAKPPLFARPAECVRVAA